MRPTRRDCGLPPEDLEEDNIPGTTFDFPIWNNALFCAVVALVLTLILGASTLLMDGGSIFWMLVGFIAPVCDYFVWRLPPSTAEVVHDFVAPNRDSKLLELGALWLYLTVFFLLTRVIVCALHNVQWMSILLALPFGAVVAGCEYSQGLGCPPCYVVLALLGYTILWALMSKIFGQMETIRHLNVLQANTCEELGRTARLRRSEETCWMRARAAARQRARSRKPQDSTQRDADIGPSTRPAYSTISDENIVALSLNIVVNFSGLDSTTPMATALVSGALEKHRHFSTARSEGPVVGSVASGPAVQETANASGNDAALDNADLWEDALARWWGPWVPRSVSNSNVIYGPPPRSTGPSPPIVPSRVNGAIRTTAVLAQRGEDEKARREN